MKNQSIQLASLHTSALIAYALALVITSPALAGETCELIENGSFTEGLRGWTPDQEATIKGDGSAEIEHAVDSAGGLGGLDDNVFGFIIDALATGVEKDGFGETTVDVSVSRTLTLDCPTLEFIFHGESDIFWWGDATIDWTISLDVEDSKGVVHTISIVEQVVPTTPTPCGISLSLGGFYNHPFNANVTTVDLAGETGIPLGETITLTFRFVLHLDAPDVCDQAHYETYFIIDEIMFCCPDEPPACEGDLNGDGFVNQSDLGVLLSAFLLTDAGDLNGDGATDQADLDILLANFFSDC